MTPPVNEESGPAGLLSELEWRGMLHATTPGLPARLATGRSISGYIGFDPSGPSLHVGHLVRSSASSSSSATAAGRLRLSVAGRG